MKQNKDKQIRGLKLDRGYLLFFVVFITILFLIVGFGGLYRVSKIQDLKQELQSCQVEHLWNELDFFDWGFCSGYDGGERICYHEWNGDWYKCNQGSCEVISG